MERRNDPRYPADHPAKVTFLDGSGARFDVVIENFSGSGLALRAEVQIPPSALLRIDFDDVILLGEACHCTFQQGCFQVGVQVEHVVEQARALLRMSSMLSGEPDPSVRGPAEPNAVLHRA